MKATLLAAALVTLVGTQAQASWAENANKQYPVYTGTSQSLARAQAGRNYRQWNAPRRPYVHRKYEPR